MATTTLFFELLIIGVQTSIALAILASTFIDHRVLADVMTILQPWASALTVVFLGILYTIGLIVDRVCDAILMLVKPTIYDRPKGKLMRIGWMSRLVREARSEGRIRVLLHEQKAVPHLDYIRSRLRVVRSTLFNIIFVAVSLTVAFLRTGRSLRLMFFVWTATAPIAAVIFLTWAMLQLASEDRTEQAVAAVDSQSIRIRNPNLRSRSAGP